MAIVPISFYCIYCQQSCIPSNREISEGYCSNLYECLNHPGYVAFSVSYIDQKLNGISMYSSYKDKDYKIQLYYPSYFSPNAIIKIEPNYYFDIYSPDDGLVLSTTRHPINITPENVKDKLPTWLIFS